jgi:hypothetical protein
VRGTGAEVEGRIEIGAGLVIAKEVVTRALAIAISIILHGRHLRMLPALALMYLTPQVILLWIDPLRAVLPILRQDSSTVDDQITPDYHHPPTGTLIHLDCWTETAPLLGVTSRPLHPHQREREHAVHLLTAHVAPFLPGAHRLANTAKDATEVPPSGAGADFQDVVLQGVVLRGVVLLDGDPPVDGDGIVVGTTAAALILHDREDPNHLYGIEKAIHLPTDALARGVVTTVTGILAIDPALHRDTQSARHIQGCRCIPRIHEARMRQTRPTPYRPSCTPRLALHRHLAPSRAMILAT